MKHWTTTLKKTTTGNNDWDVVPVSLFYHFSHSFSRSCHPLHCKPFYYHHWAWLSMVHISWILASHTFRGSSRQPSRACTAWLLNHWSWGCCLFQGRKCFAIYLWILKDGYCHLHTKLACQAMSSPKWWANSRASQCFSAPNPRTSLTTSMLRDPLPDFTIPMRPVVIFGEGWNLS